MMKIVTMYLKMGGGHFKTNDAEKVKEATDWI